MDKIRPIPPTRKTEPVKQEGSEKVSAPKRIEARVEENHHLQTVLGNRFFGLREWSTMLGKPFSERQLLHTPAFPWNREFLNSPCPFTPGRSIKDTHMAFLGFEHFSGQRLSISGFERFSSSPHQPQFSFQNHGFRENNAIRTETLQHRWYLAPLHGPHFPNTHSFEDRVSRLPQGYSVSSAIEEMTKNFLYYVRNGQYPSQNQFSFTSSTTSQRERIVVGTNNHMICFDTRTYQAQESMLSIASSIRLAR